jgi:lipoprotein-releasing system permease protein
MAVAEASTNRATRPFSPFEWMLALRYLRPRRKEAFISVIAGFSFAGILLGVATLVVVMAVMNGFRTELLEKILGINGHLIVQSADGELTNYGEVADRIAAVPGVTAALPIIEGQALASGLSDSSSGVLVRGVRGPDLLSMEKVAGTVQNGGGLLDFDNSGGVAIGSVLAQNLGLSTGDRLTLVSPRGAVTPMGTAPRIKAYPVVAIFQIGMSEYDATYVFMPLSEAQLYFNKGDSAQAIEVYVDDPDGIGAMRPPIEAAAGRSVYSTDWRQRNVTFFSALEVERNVMFIILTMIVFVAALNIISGLIMLVKDKGRDIAILRTMGATRGAILRVFFITGASIGTVGTLAGLLLGILICANVEALRHFITWITRTEIFSPELYFLSQLPAEMDPGETTAIVLMALGLSFLATLYPAWRAARLDPVEALRYE